jgi:archaellum component FlaC
MASKLIQVRLSGEELEALETQTKEGESINLVAQRILIAALGVDRSVDKTHTNDLNERIESIEDKLSSFTGLNDLLTRLQERLQRVESHLEEITAPPEIEVSQPTVDTAQVSDETTETEIVDNVSTAVNGNDYSSVDTVDSNVNKSDRLLTQKELSERLGVHAGTLTRNRSKANFADWSADKDPEKLAWKYLPEVERYTAVVSTVLSTASTTTEDGGSNLAAWKARVDEVVGAL